MREHALGRVLLHVLVLSSAAIIAIIVPYPGALTLGLGPAVSVTAMGPYYGVLTLGFGSVVANFGIDTVDLTLRFYAAALSLGFRPGALTLEFQPRLSAGACCAVLQDCRLVESSCRGDRLHDTGDSDPQCTE